MNDDTDQLDLDAELAKMDEGAKERLLEWLMFGGPPDTSGRTIATHRVRTNDDWNKHGQRW